MRRANVVKTRLLQAYRKKNRKLYEEENKLLLLYYFYYIKGWCDSSPISQRTRSRVCQNKVLRCENGKEEWNLDDYERWESKERKEVKIVSNYRQHGIMPLSPHANSKTILLSGKRNVKSTKLQKKNSIKSSTPIRPSMPKSKELELSPIPKSTDSLNVYDWNAIQRKLLESKIFYELKLIAENELNKVSPLPDRFVGDKSLSGDTIDNVAMKFFPADTPQQFLCHHAVITGEGWKLLLQVNQ